MKLSILSLILLALFAFTACESERVEPEVLVGDSTIDTGNDMERSSCYEFVGRVTRPLTFPVTITFDGGRTTHVVATAADLAVIDARCLGSLGPVTRPTHGRTVRINRTIRHVRGR